MYNRLEGEVAALNIEGKFVYVHPAGADQHLVIRKDDLTVILNREIRTGRGLVIFYPV